MQGFELPGRPEQTGNTNQRILRRQITVRRRKHRRTLNVRHIIGAAGGYVHQLDPKFSAQCEQPVCLCQVNPNPGAIATKRIRIASFIHISLACPILPGMEGDEIKGRQPYTDFKPRCFHPNSRDNFTQKPRAVLKTSAKWTGAVMCCQELMPEVAMAVFEIDKVKTGLPGQYSRMDERIDNPVDPVI